MNKFNLLFSLLIPAVALGQPDPDKVKNTVKKATIRSHIDYLASDELRGRETGTPGIEKAADYLARQFSKFGVQPVSGAKKGYFQEVPLIGTSPAQSAMIEINGRSFVLGDDLVLLSGKNKAEADKAIYLNYGLGKDYEGKNVKGKIVIAKAGSPGQTDSGTLSKIAIEKRALAKASGAAAFIEFHSFDPEYWQAISGHFRHEKMSLAKGIPDDIIHIWINSDAIFLDQINSGALVDIKLEIKGRKVERLSSRNIVGVVEGTDPVLKHEYVIYSAHYDHIGVGEPNAEGDSIYNGARDNAVGTVTVLSAAENIAKYPTKRSALFILFTAEEKGLLGSKWYVENPMISLRQMVYCFNSDNGSYNDTTVATIVGLERTTASDNIKQACKEFGLTAIDDPAPAQNLFDRSDNVHFAAQGIPAPTFSLGFTAFDAEIFKYYHQVTDNPESLDYNYLLKFFRSYVLACRKIANNQQKPFWVRGDKYYEAGLKLYGQ